MTEIQLSTMGLTPRMKAALEAITVHVSLHGVMPSRRSLAIALDCKPNNANRLMGSLIERGEINSLTPGGGADRLRPRRRCGFHSGAPGGAARLFLLGQFREDNGRGRGCDRAASRSTRRSGR